MCTHRAILLLIRRSDTLAGKLPHLADRDKRSAEAHRNDRAQEEPARIEAYDDINLLRGRLGDDLRCNVVHEVRNQCLKCDRIAEDGEDVKENNAL